MDPEKLPKISASKYATRTRELVSLVDQLRVIGAQTELDLPRITVIGKQSAGKSSIVEAISGINVPRDGGTCTRCPMECRLSSSTKPWSCKISIRHEFDVSGKRLNEIYEVPFGDVITDKADVEPMVRRAQFSILNPHIPLSTVLSMPTMTPEDEGSAPKKSLGFSKNVVCVNLQGPELPDLSFIDLPGLVQNRTADEVQLVNDLVVSYIQGNCIILVALPVTDDMENQLAMNLARKADPTGRRTIGVLTKPDMLLESSIKAQELWSRVMRGQEHILKHGYYCVRLSDDRERDNGITQNEARAAEMEFFAKSLWSQSLPMQRLGVSNLVATLSELLIRVIDESLPRIQSQASKGLETCIKELKDLPPLPDMAPGSYMMILLTNLCNNVQQYIEGGPTTSSLIHRNREAYSKFQLAIKKTTPNFTPQARSLSFRGFIQSEEDWASDSPPIYLDDMQKHIAMSVTRELPNNVPYEAKVALIAESQSKWALAVHRCAELVRESLLTMLHECVAKKIQQHDILQGVLMPFITELVTKHYDSCLRTLNLCLKAELTPFTLNLPYLESCTSTWLAKYKAYRSRCIGSNPSAKETEPVANQSVPSVFAGPKFFSNTAADSPSASTPQFIKTPLKTKTNGKVASASDGQPSSPAVGIFGPSSESGSVQLGLLGRPPLTPAASSSSATPFSFSDVKPLVFPPNNSPFVKLTNSKRPETPGSIPNPPVESTTAGPLLDRTHPDYSSTLASILNSFASIGYTGLSISDLEKLRPADEYEAEIKVMAEVRGYFQVAHERIIDLIAMQIDLNLVKAVGDELLSFLISKFELGTANADARCIAYVGEDPRIVERREELMSRKKIMEKIQLKLSNFGFTY